MCDKITFVFFLARGFFIAFLVMVKISRCKDNKKIAVYEFSPSKVCIFVLLSVLFNISRTSAKRITPKYLYKTRKKSLSY